MAASNFRVATTIELKPEVNQADLRNSMTQIRAMIDKMNINAKALQGTQGSVKLLFGGGVSPQQRGAVTGLARDVLGIKAAMSGVNDEVDKFDPKGRRSIGTILAWAAGWQIAYGAINVVKQSIGGTIKDFGDLEMAFIRIKQASGESNASFTRFTDGTFKVARATGTSITDISVAAKIWAQQGKSIAESLRLTETATIAVNLTGQSTQETISQLTGVMNAWGYTTEQTTLALDKFAKVADKEAVEVKDLMEGFLNVGLTAKMAGVSFEELNGILTAIVTVTRKAGSEVGDAMRTMFTRYMRADTLNIIQTLSKVAVFIDEFGNATYRNTGRIRSFTDTYRDLVKVMPTLAGTTQAKIIEQLTGARRGEIGKALLERPDIVSRVQAEQVNAFGYSAQKNAEIMETWQKKVAVLAIAMQQLGQAIAQSGLMDFLTQIVEGFTNFIDALRLARESIEAFFRIFVVIAGSTAFTKLIFNLGAVTTAFNTVKVAAISAKLTLGAIGGVALIALSAVLNEIKKWQNAEDNLTQVLSDLYTVPDARKSQFSGMSQEKRDETRVKMLTKMREEMQKGNRDSAIRLANEIKELDIATQVSKTKKESIGIKLPGDTVTEQKFKTENLRHELALQQSIGVNAIAMKRYELEEWLKINDTQANSVEYLKLQNELMETYVKEVYSLANAYEKVVSEGINKVIEGTGTLADIGKNLFDTARKSIIEDAVSLFGQQFGIFNLMSSATKSPIAQAHLNGITAGSKLIIQAHIAGIQAGLAGQSSAQAVANMQGGGIAGGAIQSMLGKQAPAGAGGNLLGQLGFYGGAPSAAQATANAKALGLTGQARENYMKQQRQQGQLGGAIAGGIYGISQYQATRASGGSPVASAASGILGGIGMMGIMSGNPVTMLGGAVLMGVGMLIGEMSKKKQETVSVDVREQTNQVTSRLNISNKQLEIVNRNLVALRKGFEGWVLQESYYLRSRSGTGVSVQNEFALNMRRGNQ